ncbi:sugar transferase, partial [Candidatus Peregrinibacteria bacterium]|nr:sugar transferase [Candidatus Peregrinibacteria bacterium]
GPRPEQAVIVDHLKTEIPFYTERLLVRPGITGWAQLHEPRARAEDALEKLQYDLFYVKHRSLLLDLEIILKTLRILIL